MASAVKVTLVVGARLTGRIVLLDAGSYHLYFDEMEWGIWRA